MRNLIFLFLLVALPTGAFAQSRRVAPGAPTPPAPTADALLDALTAEQMFAEANAYTRKKFAEFESKKIPYSDNLFKVTVREQKQLAAKYAGALAARPDLKTEEIYYAGMLNWLADNADNAAEYFQKYLAAAENQPAEKSQTARSIIVVVAARRKNFEEAEKRLAEYLKTDPVKFTERARMESELAKSYRSEKNFKSAASHAEEAYRVYKVIFQDSVSRARGLDDLYDAAMTAFEIHRDGGQSAEAEKLLEDLRKTAAFLGSTAIYYAAADETIKYLIATGRKPFALETYKTIVARSEKDFPTKALQEDAARRLKRREKHYKLLGEPAPELAAVAHWFPGEPKTFAALRGKVVLLDFWATWCVPCIQAFPALAEWHQTFQKDGLEILGVTKYNGEAEGFAVDNASEIEFLKRFRKTHRLPYDFVVARDGTNQKTYDAGAIPTAVLIDRQGVIRYIETGSSRSREEEIRKEIEKLLAEK